MSRQLLRFINNILATAIVVLALFILFSPFIPEFQLDVSKQFGQGTDLDSTTGSALLSSSQIPDQNTVIIPEIGIHGVIYEGKTADTMNSGIWHRPLSSHPGDGGNTVLVAHRYLYTSGPDTFYHLPKIQPHSQIVIFWDKKEYRYEVINTKVVDANQIEIEKQTSDSILTLYTCTPLWTSEKRFVVQAKLVEPL
ncbi:MAG: sortase [Candidatus Roizmanbacteria bacterium]